MTQLKRVSLLVLIACVMLCASLLVCSCGEDDNKDTDTATDTDAGVNLNDGKYRVQVVGSDGKAIEGAMVQVCTEAACEIFYTDANGYIEVPSAEYHFSSAIDLAGNYNDCYEEKTFAEGETLIVVVLEAK